MGYAEYDFYRAQFPNGKISQEQWPRAAMRADAYVDGITYGRLRQGAVVTDNVRRAVCAVAEVFARQDAEDMAHAGNVQREDVDGLSVTFVPIAEREAQRGRQLLAAAELWLPRTDALRFAGVRG